MLFLLNICNIWATLFVYFSNYIVMKNGEEFVDLRFLIVILLSVFLYKIYISYIYGVNYNVFSLFKIYWNTELSVLNKILNSIAILFTTILFCGLNLIFFKIFLIESNLNLKGSVKLFTLLFDNLYLVKIYSIELKQSLMKSMLESLDKEILNKLLSDPSFEKHLKGIILNSNCPLDLKNNLDIYIKYYDIHKEVFHYNNILYTIVTSTSFLIATSFSYYFFPDETIHVLLSSLLNWNTIVHKIFYFPMSLSNYLSVSGSNLDLTPKTDLDLPSSTNKELIRKK